MTDFLVVTKNTSVVLLVLFLSFTYFLCNQYDAEMQRVQIRLQDVFCKLKSKYFRVKLVVIGDQGSAFGISKGKYCFSSFAQRNCDVIQNGAEKMNGRPIERKNTGQLSLACTGHLRDHRQPRRLGSVLPSSNAMIVEL